MAIAGADLLAQIEQEYPKLGLFIRNYLLPSIQKTASNAAVSSQSDISAPEPPESVHVTTSGEMMQVVVNHTGEIQKGVHHIVSIATNPQFTNAMIKDEGASRCPTHYTLPTKNAAGDAHKYYVAVQTQYPGSKPSAPTYYGGSSPTAITLNGSTAMDIVNGTGAGTAVNGAEALVGIGKSQVRLAASAKRTVGQ